jgi:hypothetical protein
MLIALLLIPAFSEARVISVQMSAPTIAFGENQKGDRLLFFSFLGRPRGRNVLASPNIEAILTCHSVLP